MIQKVSPGVTDGEKSTPAPSVRHVSGEIDVSPECEQLKFVPSYSTTPQGTSKSTLDMEQIKTYVNTYVDKHIVEMKTLISNIFTKVIKTLKKEENKASPHEDEDKGPVIEIRNDEPLLLQLLEIKIQECVYTHTECPTTTDVQRE
ncbi:hypothetical protein P3L10_020593 [Capsicum annuum]